MVAAREFLGQLMAAKKILINKPSLIEKLRAYCEFYKSYRAAADFPAGLDVAAQEGKLSLLRAVSKELDVRIKDLLSEEEQAILLKLMLQFEVDAVDLPKPLALRRVRHVIEINRLSAEEDLFLAKKFLEAPLMALLSAEELTALGVLVDKYCAVPHLR